MKLLVVIASIVVGFIELIGDILVLAYLKIGIVFTKAQVGVSKLRVKRVKNKLESLGRRL